MFQMTFPRSTTCWIIHERSEKLESQATTCYEIYWFSNNQSPRGTAYPYFWYYRISSKNSAPLIIRHPFAELGQKTSIFGKGIPKYFQI